MSEKSTEEKFEIVLGEFADSGDYNKLQESNHIRYPLYTDFYKEAFNAIIENSYAYDAEREIRSRKNYDKELDQDFREEANLNKVNNIIAFVGERGSGKTTLVNELRRILYGMNSEKKGNWLQHMNQSAAVDYYQDKSMNFLVLDPLDASLLEEKENIVELIWANMYDCFDRRAHQNNNMNNASQVKAIIQGFNEVYKDYRQICRQNQDDGPEVSVLNKLKNMSSSTKIREIFGKLLQDYLDFMLKEKVDRKYLVVTIDDLDMNLYKGFEILEQIHKYLSYPQIIVLLALDYEQASLLSETHFMQNMLMGDKTQDMRVLRHARKLSYDYTLKVIPVNNRIYLLDKDVLLKQAFIKANDVSDIILPIKEYIFYKFAEKTGIYYDGRGLKRHFYLPTTIREIVGYNSFLDTLFSIPGIENSVLGENEKLRVFNKYDQNYRRVNQDIKERLVYQLLNPEQRSRFKMILERALERRAQYVVNFLSKWMLNESVIDDVDEVNYAYSDLLDGLYSYGRKRYEDKAMVHCILASFTVEMTREYYSYIYNVGMEEAVSKRRLKYFIGKSFGGEWFCGILPVIEDNDKNSLTDVGYIGSLDLYRAKIEFTRLIPGGEYNSNKKLSITSIQQILEKENVIENLCCMLMFLYNYRMEKETEKAKVDIPELSFDFQRGESVGNTIEEKMWVTIGAQYASFDIFGFMGEMESCNDKINKIKERIKTGLLNSLKAKCEPVICEEDLKNIEQEIDKRLDIIPEIKEGYAWKVDFPFYNLDLSYNVMKRVRLSCKSLNMKITRDNLCDYLRMVYGFIEKELSEEDDFYRGVKKTNEVRLADNFVSGRFIQMFGMKYMHGEREDIRGVLPENFQERLLYFLNSGKVSIYSWDFLETIE